MLNGSGGRHRTVRGREPVPARARALLPAGLRVPAAVMAGLAAAVVAVLAVRYAGDSGPGRVDGHLDRAADALPGQEIARMIIVFGDPLVVTGLAAVVALACLLGRWPRAALLTIVGPGLTGLATTFGKPLVDRTIGHGLAFPSGHTGGATSLALVVALLAAALLRLDAVATLVLAAVCAVGAGGAVGTGMVLRGNHYPTDVVGGFCTAVTAVLVVAVLIDAVTAPGGRGSPGRPEGRGQDT